MHRWNKTILIAMVSGLLFGSAVPAQAQQVPFDVVVPVPAELDVRVKALDKSSGFVGGCDVQLQCVGASVRVAHTGGRVDIGDVSVALAGSVCLMDEAAPCGSPGDPGTGFVFTRRDLIVGPTTVEVPKFTLEFCMWEQDPRDAPSSCTTVPIDPSTMTPVSTSTGTSSLGGIVPERIVIGSFGN